MNEQTIKYLEEYNRIEKHLKATYGKGNESFAALVGKAKKTNRVIRREFEMLYSLRKLRNVLVHESGQTIIAIPSDEALEAIQRIADSLIKPTKAYDVIDHDFIKMDAHDTLSETLKTMKKHNYSQIPVYSHRKFIGLLTGNTVTRWMTNNMDEEDDLKKSLNDIYLKELLDYCEAQDDVDFVHRHILASELMAMVEDNPPGSGTYIMTENGKADERPLGIITVHDYATLESSI